MQLVIVPTYQDYSYEYTKAPNISDLNNKVYFSSYINLKVDGPELL